MLGFNTDHKSEFFIFVKNKNTTEFDLIHNQTATS